MESKKKSGSSPRGLRSTGAEARRGVATKPATKWQRSAASWLGSRPNRNGAISFDLGSELQLDGAIRIGLPTRVADEVVDAGLLTAPELFDLVLPRRTLAHRKDREQRLSPEESDRLARVVRVIARSEQALGNTESASRWLRKANRALAGNRPLELLGSDAGARAVEKVLGRIEHGVYS